MAKHNSGPRGSIQLKQRKLTMKNPKPSAVTDAQLAAAAVAWGQARLAAYHGPGTFTHSENLLSELYDLAMRAVKEREKR